jgi:hypothetical protein
MRYGGEHLLASERCRLGHVATRSVGRSNDPSAFHDHALRAAGFNAVGEVWRHHANVIVLAVREKPHAK